MNRKLSFFERLTGSTRQEDVYEDDADLEIDVELESHDQPFEEEIEEEGQLAVDVYHTDHAIIVKAMTAGVRKEDLEINLSREMITIRGYRKEDMHIDYDSYFFKELYWGAFSRTIVLPEEIDIEESHAEESHGLLTITLPKIDKKRQTTLRVI